mmetsp:Transcript_18374/g.51878  ORF Transcript_18374/g.51878 Transcript_18374/m.51878 type:complete len:149 (+) Transcript_18374:1-447(+)
MLQPPRRPRPCGVAAARQHLGPGSVAMGWLVRTAVIPFVRWVRWQGHAGAVLLDPCATDANPLLLMGIRGSHELESLRDDFAVLSDLRASAPRAATVVVAGDWNVGRRCEFDPQEGAAGSWMRPARRRMMSVAYKRHHTRFRDRPVSW